MKVQIPQELKADMPQTTWGKTLSATPVVMAVVATMLAGLASSEMTRAQYDRALAAQQQSKAGDQWSFFQAKRLRGAIQRNTADLMQNTVEVHLFDPAALNRSAEQLSSLQGSAEQQADAARLKTEMLALLASPAGQQALGLMKKGELPQGGATLTPPPTVKAALEAMENLRPDSEIVAVLGNLDTKTLDEAMDAARDQALNFDAATRPINQAIDQMDNMISRQTSLLGLAVATAASAGRDFTAARLRFTALRYEAEARLNQAIANLYELQVRKSNISATRHHMRSQRFFFGMLGAQMGVIISTLAMAARQRNLLWSLAAGAGLIAIAFAIYVYLYV